MDEQASDVQQDEQQYLFYGVTPLPWRTRLRRRLFPTRWCALPEAPGTWRDCLESRTVVMFSWADRLRVLVCGRVVFDSKTVTEHVIGGCRTSGVAYPALRNPEEDV